jgi:hypothetical protein
MFSAVNGLHKCQGVVELCSVEKFCFRGTLAQLFAALYMWNRYQVVSLERNAFESLFAFGFLNNQNIGDIVFSFPPSNAHPFKGDFPT